MAWGRGAGREKRQRDEELRGIVGGHDVETGMGDGRCEFVPGEDSVGNDKEYGADDEQRAACEYRRIEHSENEHAIYQRGDFQHYAGRVRDYACQSEAQHHPRQE